MADGAEMVQHCPVGKGCFRYSTLKQTNMRHGFTLIELSIVLVIIGLIVGGILTGQDLIAAATLRAQITQMERYNTAVRTFQGKYGALPGDISDPNATRFGFQQRSSGVGLGDGDGVLESNCAGTPSYTANGCNGELAVFWEDLSIAGLIDANILGTDKYAGNYPSMSAGTGGIIGSVTASTTPTIDAWLPRAKLGNGNYVYVYSLGQINYFAVSGVSQLSWAIYGPSNPGITVLQAYSIDKKLDDGLPQYGRINTCYLNYPVLTSNNGLYAAGNGTQGMGGYSATTEWCTPDTTAVARASQTCFDNNGVGGATQQYSITNNANIANCALSFRFQ